MLFNSLIYLFLFLPIVVVGYYLISKHLSHTARNTWVIVASLFFYGFWNPVYIPLLLGSVIVNFYLGSLLAREKVSFNKIDVSRRVVLIFGIVLNVSLLGIFKYTDFFITNINWILGKDIPLAHLVLPLAISFFTFQQIAYLVDSYKRLTQEYSFLNYAVFVMFFPQLIAGPIVHHKEMLPQFENKESGIINYRNMSVGLFIICMGLVKKVGIADTFAEWANAGYMYEGTLTFFDAWTTSLSYTFQLYFDFSGYTDMAIGSALLFNISLPQNFNSPYKALNIQDFWRRWHMTLSRFLRDYIYIPLGGNRQGLLRFYLTLLAVFLIGGLWHGASWTFVVWGMLHGIATIIHRIWSTYGKISLPSTVSWFITFNFINITWVFFRADSFSKAYEVLKSMFGIQGWVSITNLITNPKWDFSELAILIIPQKEVIVWSVLTLLGVLFLKNSDQIRDSFSPTLKYALIFLVLYIAGIMNLGGISEFLYFNF